MKLKFVLLGILTLLAMTVAGCGSGAGGGAGLNGGIGVTATQTGSVINATATYTNPTQTNLVGVPITFAAIIGNQSFPLGTHNTNNTGAITVAFTPPAFNGTRTVVVTASSDNLTNFASVNMTGRSLTVTAPPKVDLSTSLAGGTSVPIQVPSTASFVTITDPFGNDISGHTIQISASFSSTNPSDTLVAPTVTTTGSGGTAFFPGATGTMTAPAAVGAVDTMTIVWTVTDIETGQTGSAITTVTLTRTA